MTVRDTKLALGGSLILHGPLSDRAYLAKLAPGEADGAIKAMDRLAGEHGYGKLFAKVPESAATPFLESGYVTEALVPGMFPLPGGSDREPGHFMAKFPDPARRVEENAPRALLALRLAAAKAPKTPPDPPDHWRIERLGPDDAGEMARLYDNAFTTYPFPINDPEFLRRNMAGHVFYYGVRLDGGPDGDPDRGLVALGACETDPELGLTEMTDFGSLPDARGSGAAYHLIGRMERDMRGRGIAVAYTISRGLSVPINVSFARRGYGYAGAMLANTNIAGSLESMNVWFKDLLQPQPDKA